MFRKSFRALADSPFLGEALPTQDAEEYQEERLDVLEALKAVITEAFALYMETKSLSWSLACSPFSSEGPSLDEQAEILFCHIDRLVHLAHGRGGTVLYQDQQMPFWQRRTDSWKKDQDVFVMMHQVIKDHQRLAWRLQEAIAMCQHHHERESCLALQKVLLETENRARRFAHILDHLHLLSNVQEVSR